MKNFGTKSLSSIASVLLSVSWYVVLVGAICAGLFMTAVISSEKIQTFISTQIEKDAQKPLSTTDHHDVEDWQKFQNAPLAAKILAFPYMAAVTVLLLMIIRRSKLLFDNFRKDVVFNRSNVEIITKINKLLIPFSIITFNFSGLLTCVLLYMLGEIFKNGAALQEEHDLTV